MWIMIDKVFSVYARIIAYYWENRSDKTALVMDHDFNIEPVFIMYSCSACLKRVLIGRRHFFPYNIHIYLEYNVP